MSAEQLLASNFAALPDLIRAHAAERPDQPALVEGDATLTYGGLAALMDRVSAALQRDGVGSGDAVAICARTSINYAAAFCGILAAGAAVAPLAPSSTPASLDDDAQRQRRKAIPARPGDGRASQRDRI